jgi:hypothetical protein
MNHEVERFEGELRILRKQNKKYKDALHKIEEFGHNNGHGRGYTCANIAKEALESN